LHSKSKTEFFKVTVKTQEQFINISILLWQHFSELLDHLQPAFRDMTYNQCLSCTLGSHM